MIPVRHLRDINPFRPRLWIMRLTGVQRGMPLEGEAVDLLKQIASGRLGPPVLVYHWDADGLAAATTFMKFYGGDSEEVELRPPRFVRSFSFKELLEGAENRPVVVLDLTPRTWQLREALEVASKVVVVDHHYVDWEVPEGVAYINPAARGDLKGEWPSATWVLAEALGAHHPLLTAASIVGDLGRAALGNPVYARVMRESGLDPERDYWIPEEIAENLDSLHKACKYQGLQWYPRLLSYPTVDPAKGALEDVYLVQLRATVGFEMEELLERLRSSVEEPCEGVLAARIEGGLLARGSLSRELLSLAKARNPPGSFAVLAYRAKCDCCTVESIYARTWKIVERRRLEKVGEALKRLGLEPGGKIQRGNLVVAAEANGKLDEAYKAVVEALCSG